MLFRHLRVAFRRVMLTALGIMLGAAVVFAVKVVNSSVLSAMHRSMAHATGKAKLSIGAGVGVDEEMLERVRAVPGISAAIPVIETTLRDVNSHTVVTVLALDILSDPQARADDAAAPDAHVEDVVAYLNDLHGVLITPAYAKHHHVAVGDTLLLDGAQGRQAYTVHGTLDPRGPATAYGGNLLLMDVYSAQVAFDRGRRFDRIDIVPDEGVEVSALASRIEQVLEHRSPVSRPEQRAAEAERLLSGFRLALSLMSIVALFVGGFIIYNSLAIAVAQRRREIGIIRALGVTRGQVLVLFVAEGIVIGLSGAVAGLGFGFVLARGALDAVAATISMLYMPVQVDSLVIAGSDLWLTLGVGVGTAVLSAFVPARRAASIAPVEAMSSTIEAADVTVSSATASLRIVSVLLLVTALVAWAAHAYRQSSLAFAVAALLSLCGAFIAPLLAGGVGHVAQRYAKYLGPSVLLGAMAFARNRGRNAIAIAALGMALANMVNVDALIDSMKGTTDAWLDRSFRADLFTFSGTEVHAKFEHPLPVSLRGELAALPDVEFVQAFRSVRLSYHGEPFYLMSEDSKGYQLYNELAIVAGDPAEAWQALDAGTALAASEIFARTFGVGVGDHVTLDTPSGPVSFRIALVYSDYRADIGILFTSRAAYTRIFRDELVDLYSLYLKHGASVEATRETIVERFAERHGLLVLGSADYKRDLIGLVERSMSLSRATELVAILVAGFGIINALLVSVLDRRREIGMLKALGTARKQLKRAVLTEALLLGGSAVLLGLILGGALAAYVVLEAMRIEVGWHIALHLSGWVIVETIALALPIAWLAAWWPMGWVARVEVVEALQGE
ncbi:MAG: FtsX-like permease family protein [Polyangiales bacterium]